MDYAFQIFTDSNYSPFKNKSFFFELNKSYLKTMHIDKHNSKQLQFILKAPGQSVKLPSYILEDLKSLDPKYKRNISFFGGHPISITKQSLNSIFTDIKQKEDGTIMESQYLVCEKTDGVRYLLLICHVHKQDLITEQDSKNVNKYGAVQCYMVSRQGQKGLVAYAVNMKIGIGWTNKSQQSFKHIIQILDGQLVIDNTVGQYPSSCKFLIFDILVHLQQNITKFPLKNRLKQACKFIECNSFLLDNTPASKNQKSAIPLQIKDFFRLNSQKYNIIKFLLNKYINCLPHQNDGLIFNHQAKPYEFGMNEGYIKWKPAHLNTLDFMMIPNTNIGQQNEDFNQRILDMYLATKDPEVEGNYVRMFYGFMVVKKEEFRKIEQITEENKTRAYEMKIQNDQDFGDKGHFEGSVIAQCKFQQTNLEQKDFLNQIYDIKKKTPQQIYKYVEKPFIQQAQLKRIQTLQKAIYDRSWKIYKIRQDKGLPNNVNVAVKIEQSIKDNILEQELIKRNDQLNEKVFGRKPS